MTDKGLMVTLKGEIFDAQGERKLTRSKYFDFLNIDLDDYNDVEYTEAEARKVSNHLRKISTGSAAMVPMFCAGPECPFADRCPLQQMNKAPVGKPCYLEVQMMNRLVMVYMEEYDVDPNTFTEVAYINELAEIEVYLWRLNMSLARPENAELVTEQPVGATKDGDPIMQLQVSPYMEQRERLLARRNRVVKLMVGDRQEKYKKEAALKVRLEDDPSTQFAEMRTRMANLSRAIPAEPNQPNLLEAKPGSVSPDDLIGRLLTEGE